MDGGGEDGRLQGQSRAHRIPAAAPRQRSDQMIAEYHVVSYNKALSAFFRACRSILSDMTVDFQCSSMTAKS